MYRVYAEKQQGIDYNIEARLSSEDLCGASQIWIGKDYVNFIVKDFCDLDSPFDGEYWQCVFRVCPLRSWFSFSPH